MKMIVGSFLTDDNVRPVRRIHGTSTIRWQNSTLERRKFYDIKFPSFEKPRSGRNKIEIL